MFQDFNCQLFDYSKYEYDDSNIQKEKEYLNTDKEETVFDEHNLIKLIEPYLDNDDNIEFNKYIPDKKSDYNSKNKKVRNNNKKRKIPKMKNYNYKKGDWQCKECFNINFHFRNICNVCKRCK